jgi:hypothetical protein
MASKVHPNEEFIKKLSVAELEALMLEAQLPDSPARYVAALKDQLTRLEIKF